MQNPVHSRISESSSDGEVLAESSDDSEVMELPEDPPEWELDPLKFSSFVCGTSSSLVGPCSAL